MPIDRLALLTLGIGLTIASLTLCNTARADDAKDHDELAWNPAWSKFRTSEYVLTLAAGAGSAYAFFAVDPPSHPHWTGGILLDTPIRNAVYLRTEGARDTARTASNVTSLSAVVIAVGVDSLIVPLFRHKSEVAAQLVLMDAEAFAFSSLLTNSLLATVGRARPSYADCQRDPNFDRLCRSAPQSSFPSGHTNVAFTAAGMSCAHHLHLSLYGSTLEDTLACGGMITLGAATGMFRLLGDRHYASDVFVGALTGFAFGYGMPTLFHYGKAERGTQNSLVVLPATGGLGPSVAGTF